MDDPYTPIYCAGCFQLRWHDFRRKPCQFCGQTEFTHVRPEPTMTVLDAKTLKPLRIPVETAEEGSK